MRTGCPRSQHLLLRCFFSPGLIAAVAAPDSFQPVGLDLVSNKSAARAANSYGHVGALLDAYAVGVIAPNNLYRFVWSNNTDGVGIKQGNNVAVGIGGARCGFVSYEVKSDGTLDGVWGGYGSQKVGFEKATKQ